MGCGLRLLSLIVIRDSFFVIREGGGPDGPQIIYGECAQAGLKSSLAIISRRRPCAIAHYKNWFPQETTFITYHLSLTTFLESMMIAYRLSG